MTKTNKDIDYRYDMCELKRAYYDKDGFLIVDAIVTRTGVFTYMNNDGTLRKELRHPDDILKKSSLDTMKMLPLTFMHPVEKVVDAHNSAKLSKGFTGQDVSIDGKYIYNRLKVTDHETITAVENGIQELSLGYEVTLIEEAGDYCGEQYTHRQTDCVYNHIAIVPEARAGAQARIKLDNAYSVQQIHLDNKSIKIDGKKPSISFDNQPNKPKENRMIKFSIDGIDYDASPEVVNHAKRESKRADDAEATVKSLTEKLSKETARADSAEESLKIAKEKTNADAIQKAVTERIALVNLASPHLDENTVKSIHTLDEKAIKSAVILAHFPEAKLDGKDDVYIAGRFDAAIEMDTKNIQQNADEANADAKQRQQMNNQQNNDANSNVPDQEKSRLDMIARLTGQKK